MPVLSNIRKAEISQSAQFLTVANNLKPDLKREKTLFDGTALFLDLLITVFFDEVKLIVNSS